MAAAQKQVDDQSALTENLNSQLLAARDELVELQSNARTAQKEAKKVFEAKEAALQELIVEAKVTSK